MKPTSDFQFSRYERNGIIFLSILIVCSIAFKSYIVNYWVKDEKPIVNDPQKIRRLEEQIASSKTNYSNDKENKWSHPNQHTNWNTNTTVNSNAKAFSQKSTLVIEVNSATVSDYEKLYGIGKVYATRIVSFRDKLGGFYSIDQIKHVYGIEDAVFQKFKKNLTIKPVKAKKLNINTATFEELTANPYFFSTVAKQIIGYRTKVKPFITVEDIKNLYFIKDHPEHYDKMLPYVAIE